MQPIEVLPAPISPRLLGLIVSTPERQRGSVAKTQHLRFGLGQEIGLPQGVLGHHRTSRHEILPHQNALFIAEVIERFVSVISASPDPKHVHVSCLCIGHNPPPLLLCHRWKKVRGNHIGPSHLHRNTVDLTSHGPSMCIGGHVPF